MKPENIKNPGASPYPHTLYVMGHLAAHGNGLTVESALDPIRYAHIGEETEVAVYQLMGTITVAAKVVVSPITPHGAA